MREADIKALLINQLRADRVLSAQAIIANEYPLGRTSVRADLAFLASDFVGVEIKSEYDSLRRLPHQLSMYRQFFDRTILVVAKRHLAGVQNLNLEGVELWQLAGRELQLLDVHPQATDKKPLTELLTAAQRQKWIDGLDLDKAREAFTAAFQARFGQTSQQFWSTVGRRKVISSDFLYLSRFQHVRNNQVRLRTERAEMWQQWAAAGDAR